MSKVKVTNVKSEVKDIELEYPIYLYFQDEGGNDEVVMLTEDYQITVKHDYSSLIIDKSNIDNWTEGCIRNNLTTKSHFLEVYREALKSIEDKITLC